jgi:cyclopropane-fatty-acyl-phospholipid synthase
MGRQFPNSKITAVSNSKTQKEFIDKKAEKLGLKNITIITSDMNQFDTSERFDRVVSERCLST